MSTHNAFKPSPAALEWMASTPVSKQAEATSIEYLKSKAGPVDMIERFHHIQNISNSFDTRLNWLEDTMNRGTPDVWRDTAVNKIIGARVIFVAEEHKKAVATNSPFSWDELIERAKKKYPQ